MTDLEEKFRRFQAADKGLETVSMLNAGDYLGNMTFDAVKDSNMPPEAKATLSTIAMMSPDIAGSLAAGILALSKAVKRGVYNQTTSVPSMFGQSGAVARGLGKGLENINKRSSGRAANKLMDYELPTRTEYVYPTEPVPTRVDKPPKALPSEEFKQRANPQPKVAEEPTIPYVSEAELWKRVWNAQRENKLPKMEDLPVYDKTRLANLHVQNYNRSPDQVLSDLSRVTVGKKPSYRRYNKDKVLDAFMEYTRTGEKPYLGNMNERELSLFNDYVKKLPIVPGR